MNPPNSVETLQLFDEEPSSIISSTQAGQPVFRPAISWYDGVVPQQNGFWGAEIYVYPHLILLGKFKSEIAAARAYDSAGLKLHNGDFFRNFLLTNVTIHESLFQSMYNNEAIIDMIRNGSYNYKFIEFVWIHHNDFRYSGFTALPTSLDAVKGFFFRELFHKELILADIENPNIFVLPYQAQQYILPLHSNTVEQVLEFNDRMKRTWVYQCCYRNSIQSYVFTTGWKKFMNEMELCVNDIIVFYRCRDWGRFPSKNFYMVDIIRSFRNSGKPRRSAEGDIHVED